MRTNYEILILILLFSATTLGREIHSQLAPQEARPTNSEKETDWCNGLDGNEKRQIQNELAQIYSKYLSTRDQDALDRSVTRVVEDHTLTGDYQKKIGVAREVFSNFESLRRVQRFSQALSNLSDGKAAADLETQALANKMKEDFGRLTRLGLKYDSKKQKWDFSGSTNEPIKLDQIDKGTKAAFENLISPEIAKRFFDPERREAFSLNGFVVRPPVTLSNGTRNEFRIVAQEDQDRALQRSIELLKREKEAFLTASKEANTRSNYQRGRILEWFGAERGYQGETAPEIARNGALSAMENQLKFVRGTLGVRSDVLDPLYSSVRGALTSDSQSLEALDRSLTEKIEALKTAEYALGAIAVTVATAGVLAPTALAAVLGSAGASTLAIGGGTTSTAAVLGSAGASTLAIGGTTSTVAAAMALPLVLHSSVAVVNSGIESARNGTKFSCALLEELDKRGATAISHAAIAGAIATTVTAGAGILPMGATPPPASISGSTTLINGTQATLTYGKVGVAVAMSGLGVKGLWSSGSAISSELTKANEAESEGDLETAARRRTAAMKQSVEFVANGALELWGLRNLYSGIKELRPKNKGAGTSLEGEAIFGHSPVANKVPTGVLPPPEKTLRVSENGYLDKYSDDLIVFRGKEMDDALTKVVLDAPKRPGWLTVAVHGTSFKGHIIPKGYDATKISPRTDQIDAGILKELIRDAEVNLDKYEGVIFVSCFGGSCQNGASQAMKFGDQLGMPVIAADGKIRVRPEGNATKYRVEEPQNGSASNPWYISQPEKLRRSNPQGKGAEEIVHDLNQMDIQEKLRRLPSGP